MIFTPKQTAFEMSRGDNFILPITINKGTQLNFEHYTLGEQDRLYVGIMEPDQSFENAIIRKIYTEDSNKDDEGNILFELVPQDTQYLMTGKYYICIKLKQFDVVTTILPMREFWITGTNPPTKEVQNTESKDDTIIWDGGEIV